MLILRFSFCLFRAFRCRFFCLSCFATSVGFYPRTHDLSPSPLSPFFSPLPFDSILPSISQSKIRLLIRNDTYMFKPIFKPSV